MKFQTSTVGSLSAWSVYLTGGEMYVKLNEEFHVRARIDGEKIVGAGCVEAIEKTATCQIILNGRGVAKT